MPDKAVGWIASRVSGGQILHFAQNDGWQVDVVMTVNAEGMVNDESSGYARLRRTLQRERDWWLEEMSYATGDYYDKAKRRFTEIEAALLGGGE